jgi:protein SCO1/2
MPTRRTLFLAIAILAAALALGGAALLRWLPTSPTGTGTALVGGPFSLTDHNGKAVTDKDFLGKYMLIFFGYTYCPDFCPTELQVISAALDAMGPKGEAIQPLFISIDPERDTPAALKAYVENFNPRLIGLTGTPEQIAAVAKAYRVYYAKSGNKQSADYLMDHSTITYLMGPDGRFLKHFAYSTDASALTAGLAAAIAQGP